MLRITCGLLAVLVVVPAEEIPAAPVIEFRELTWWGQSPCGTWQWWPGQDGTPFPTNLGRIEKAKILGPQKLVWNHRFYPITSVTKTPDGAVAVGFRLGVLSMRQIQGRRWTVSFSPEGADAPIGTFQTFSDVSAFGSGR